MKTAFILRKYVLRVGIGAAHASAFFFGIFSKLLLLEEKDTASKYPARPGNKPKVRTLISKRQLSEIFHHYQHQLLTDTSSRTSANYFDALLPYRHPDIKPLILDFKYHLLYKGRVVEMAEATTELLYISEILLDEITTDLLSRVRSVPFQTTVLLIAAPSYTFVRGEKEYDQMTVLSKILMSVQNNIFSAPLLIHIEDAIGILASDSGTMHASLSKIERIMKAEKRFYIDNEKILPLVEKIKTPRIQIIMIDDITTTGATFRSIEKLLREALAPTGKEILIHSIALSH